MNENNFSLDELRALADAACNGQLSDDDIVRLERMLLDNEEAQRFYLSYVSLDKRMRWEFAHHLKQPASVQAPILANLSPTLQHSSNYFSSDWMVAYIIAAVICGVGLTIAAFTYISRPGEVARKSNAVAPASASVARITGMKDCRWDRKGLGIRDWGLEGMQNEKCKLQNANFKLNNSKSLNPQIPKSLVSLGDQFVLTTGLMEITYNSGARVILQGPCTFEVDSAAGGYLEIGKLTARVESGDGARGAGDKGRSKVQGSRFKAGKSSNFQISKSPNSSPQSLAPSPLFAVRTPTATVTDLGTEFGVAVEKDQSTQVQVIEGQVRLLASKAPGHSLVLAAGNAARVSANDPKVESVTFQPDGFMRSLAPQADSVAENPAEQAYIESVLADNPLGYWPLNEPERSRMFFDRSGNAFHGSAMNRVEAAQPGPFGEGSHAIGLDGAGYIDLGRRDQFAMQNDFTVEAWIWTEKPLRHSTIFSAAGKNKSDPSGDDFLGWGLSQYLDESGDRIGLRLSAYHEIDYPKDTVFELSNCTVPLHQWTHVAVAFDRDNTVHLYVNGKHVESRKRDRPALEGPVWVAIGYADVDYEQVRSDALKEDRLWRGRLAHVAVYPRAISEDHIRNHISKIKAPTSKAAHLDNTKVEHGALDQ